ncbi:MAG TPA: hypothetical protein VMG12_15845 [Polyangiaceae bacterium]|nr:hypothetical protein [Polyangiaceae bacterium]
MSEDTNPAESKPVDGAAPNVESPQPERAKLREALAVLKRHPLGLVVAIGAAAALLEIELAVGILTGVGATALLATKSGPEARQEVISKGQEVFTKSKAAIERARVALASRAQAKAAEPAAADPVPVSAEPATQPIPAPAPAADAPVAIAEATAQTSEEPTPTANG